MVETKAITPAQARAAARRVQVRYPSPLPVGSYFADWAASQASEGSEGLFGEVQIQTTLDSRLQRLAERTVRNALDTSGSARSASQAALVAMRPNGAVVAMVGGRDYRSSQFNRAVQARRQPGSAFKLFVYLAALRSGATPDAMVSEEPITIEGWSPRNFSGSSGGELTLRDAFSQSSNIASVRVAQTVGHRAVAQAARDLGVTVPLTKDATLALGSSEVTLLELTSAYAALSAGYAPIRAFGVLPQAPQPRPSSTLRPRERRQMLELLQAVVEEGTGRAARLDQPVYGKTGTSQDHRDAVFVGFTSDLVIGVWVGNDDHSPMKGVTGGGLPAEIWRDFASQALAAGLIERLQPPPPVEPDNNIRDMLRRLFAEFLGR
jgi:penicillin-binding protein 1A